MECNGATSKEEKTKDRVISLGAPPPPVPCSVPKLKIPLERDGGSTVLQTAYKYSVYTVYIV